MKKTMLDCWNRYLGLKLNDEVMEATTFIKFITEWGQYDYLHAPQGFQESGDRYTKRTD